MRPFESAGRFIAAIFLIGTAVGMVIPDQPRAAIFAGILSVLWVLR